MGDCLHGAARLLTPAPPGPGLLGVAAPASPAYPEAVGTLSPRSLTVLEDLLQAVVADPQAEDRYLVLADWLEEHDDPRRAELLRLHRRLLATCCEPDRHPERAGWQARVVELIGQGVRPCVPQRRVVLAKGVEMGFSFIPP